MTDRVEPVLQAAGDRQGLAKVHDARAYVFDMLRRAADVEREAELGIAQARLAGSRFHETELYWWLFWQLLRGPRPVEEAIRRCQELRVQIQDDLAAEAVFLESLGQLEAMRGRFDEARELIETSIENRNRLGLHVLTTKFSLPALGAIELLADEAKAAETALRRACDDAQETGDRETAADTAGLLIEALLAQDRLDEAEALIPAAQLAETGDAVAPQVRSRSGQARILARRGDIAGAERLAREAVVRTSETDDLNLQAAALVALADVLTAAGNHTDARATAEAALELFDRKGNVVAAKRTRALIEELDNSVDEFAPRSSSNQ